MNRIQPQWNYRLTGFQRRDRFFQIKLHQLKRSRFGIPRQHQPPLINELLEQIGQHPDFETWRQKGKIPAGTIKQLCEPLRTDSRFMVSLVVFIPLRSHG